VDGKANDECVRFLRGTRWCGALAGSAIVLGAGSRTKVIEIEGLSEDRLAELL